MYGSGRGILPGIFDKHGIQLRGDSPGSQPVISRNQSRAHHPPCAMLQETVVKEKCHAGLVTDGDADRIGAVAEDGSFVDSHKCICVLLNWLLQYKKWPGDVVRAFNTTGMIDRIAAKYGRKLHETSIGFKYIADLMMDHEILIGGEESGGIGYGRFFPSVMAFSTRSCSRTSWPKKGSRLANSSPTCNANSVLITMAAAICTFPTKLKTRAIRRAADPATTKLGAYSVLRKENKDGVKFYLDAPKPNNGADPWVLFRASGTERMLVAMLRPLLPNWFRKSSKLASVLFARTDAEPSLIKAVFKKKRRGPAAR